jgi:hypothetical protein
MKRDHEGYTYDIDRLEEKIKNRKDSGDIFSEEDFNSRFNKELDWTGNESDAQKTLRKWVWDKYKTDHVVPPPPGAPKIKKVRTSKGYKYEGKSEIGRAKGRITYGYKETVSYKGKQLVRYRNSKGQFVSVKKG